MPGLILPVIDKEDDLAVIKPPQVPNLPMHVIIVGKSLQSGKTTFLTNMLLRPYNDEDKEGEFFFSKEFKGENIYIISPSFHIDDKLRLIAKCKNIPPGNITTVCEESMLKELYDHLKQQYQDKIDNKQQPEHTLVILDDCAHSGSLKKHKHGVINTLFNNGRHSLVSTIITAQDYTQLDTKLRDGMNFGVFFKGIPDKRLELASDDFNQTGNKRSFIKLYRANTIDRHSFFAVNIKNDLFEGFYLDSLLQPIDVEQYLHKDYLEIYEKILSRRKALLDSLKEEEDDDLGD